MIILNCKLCKKEFEVAPYRENIAKYCTKSCHAKGTVAGKNKQFNYLDCQFCGNKYRINNYRLKTSKHCSMLCHNRAIAKETKESGRLLGEKNPMYKNGIQIYRRIAKENLEWICNRCESTKHLMVHHIDHDRTNNILLNLEVLCRRCHQIEHNAVENLGVHAQKK